MGLLDIQINRKSAVHLHRQIVDKIHEMIKEGKLKGGDFLPGARTFADRLGVSRATVHTAYKTLELEELIMFANHRGHRLIMDASDRLTKLERFKKKKTAGSGKSRKSKTSESSDEIPETPETTETSED